MSEPVRVLLVCADPDVRGRVRERLTDATGLDVTAAATVTGRDADCVVGVPTGDPAGFARDIVELADAPVVVYGPGERAADVLAAGADDVVRRGDDAAAVLAHRIRQVAADSPGVTANQGTAGNDRAVTADGGEATATERPSDRVDDPSEREELRASERSLQRLHELASDPEASRSEKIERMLEVGRDRIGVELGVLIRVDDDTREIVELVGDHPDLEVGATAPLPGTNRQHAIDREGSTEITDAAEDGRDDDPADEQFGLEWYLGASVTVDGEQYGTVCFADTRPRDRAFTESERTFIDLVINWISSLLEQRRYEERIRANERRLETVTDNVPVAVFALDSEGTATLARGRGLERLGFEPGEVVGESVGDLYGEHPSVLIHATRALDGEQTHHTIELDDGGTVEIWYQPVAEDGEVTQVVGVIRDITELATHRDRLSGLLETTQSLMQARSREEVADLVANAARDVLEFDLTIVRLYDPETGTLEPAARAESATGPSIGERPVYDLSEGMPGTVFATGESRVVDDLDAIEMDTMTGSLRSAVYYPMGVHGTISVGSTDRAAFDGTDEQVLGLLATAAAAACTRAKRERDVREAREHVETILERVNGLVENTIEVLVGATTREELERDVVAELAGADPHAFAWIGRPDVKNETLSPTDWAGSASVPVEDLAFDLGGSNLVATALEDGEHRVASAGDAEALGCVPDGPESCIVIPLAYKDTTYGVIAVYADESGAFDQREQAVLSALGRAVANAINAVERGRILDADRIIELELAVDDRDVLFGHLSQAGDCTVEVADFDYRSDGLLRLYLTADDTDGDRLVNLASETDAVTEAQLIVDHDEGCLLELAVEESLVGRLSEYGAVVRGTVAENGVTRVTVELPYEAEARDLFELVEDHHSDTDLVGYHEHERPVGTRQEFRAALSDRFTDRQETALRTAYFGGFFDWPRGIDGNDLADAMDVARPTYHQHLRTAQRKVFDELFE